MIDAIFCPTPRRAAWLAALLLLSVSLSGVCGATAEGGPSPSGRTLTKEQETEARVQFEKGMQRFEEGLYAEAADHFSRAYEITGEPGVLYNIGRCEEAREQNGLAIESYRLYLKNHPQPPDREEVERRIAYLESGQNYSDASVYEGETNGEAKEDEKKKAKEKKKRNMSYGFQLNLGPSFVLMSPQTNNPDTSNHPYISADIWGHFFFRPWIGLSIGLVIGGYIEGKIPFNTRDAKALLGVGAGVTFLVPLKKDKLSMPIRIAALPTAINRENVSSRASWFDFQGAVGLAIHLPRSWFLNIEALVDAGPCWVYDLEVADPWTTELYLAAGGRVGAMVKF